MVWVSALECCPSLCLLTHLSNCDVGGDLTLDLVSLTVLRTVVTFSVRSAFCTQDRMSSELAAH